MGCAGRLEEKGPQRPPSIDLNGWVWLCMHASQGKSKVCLLALEKKNIEKFCLKTFFRKKQTKK